MSMKAAMVVNVITNMVDRNIAGSKARVAARTAPVKRMPTERPTTT
jgi:hypothetical protein